MISRSESHELSQLQLADSDTIANIWQTARAHWQKSTEQSVTSPGIMPLRMYIHARLGETQLSIPPITSNKLPTVAGGRQPTMFTGW